MHTTYTTGIYTKQQDEMAIQRVCLINIWKTKKNSFWPICLENWFWSVGQKICRQVKILTAFNLSGCYFSNALKLMPKYFMFKSFLKFIFFWLNSYLQKSICGNWNPFWMFSVIYITKLILTVGSEYRTWPVFEWPKHVWLRMIWSHIFMGFYT